MRNWAMFWREEWEKSQERIKELEKLLEIRGELNSESGFPWPVAASPGKDEHATIPRSARQLSKQPRT